MNAGPARHAPAHEQAIGSGSVLPGPVVCYGYAASKAAIINVVRHAALELAPHGVLVNAICPDRSRERASPAV